MSWGVSDLTVRYGHNVALTEVDLAVEPGKLHAVVGGDGAGKSTLLKVLAGLDLGQEGSVRIPGSGRIGYVPPDGGVLGDLSVGENVEFVADAYRLEKWEPRAAGLLQRAALDQFEHRLARNLSGGQRRKLAGTLALLPRPELLVLDELTTGVDPVSRVGIWRLITAAAAEGAAVVTATSYLDEAERASVVLLLHNGRTLAAGSPQSIIDGVPGTVVDREVPDDSGTAWRRGRLWRQWLPHEAHPSGHAITFEDAAIVHELQAGAPT